MASGFLKKQPVLNCGLIGRGLGDQLAVHDFPDDLVGFPFLRVDRRAGKLVIIDDIGRYGPGVILIVLVPADTGIILEGGRKNGIPLKRGDPTGITSPTKVDGPRITAIDIGHGTVIQSIDYHARDSEQSCRLEYSRIWSESEELPIEQTPAGLWSGQRLPLRYRPFSCLVYRCKIHLR